MFASRRNVLKLSMAACLPEFACKTAMLSLDNRNFALIGDSWIGNPSVMSAPLMSAWGGTETSYGYPGYTVPLINSESWTSQIKTQKPDVVVWTYGVNDYYKNADPFGVTGIGQGIKVTAGLIQLACPGSTMLFLLPAKTEGNDAPLHSWESYQRAASESAAQVSGLHYFDMGDCIAPYSVGNPDWYNGSHLSEAGYQTLFANVPNPK